MIILIVAIFLAIGIGVSIYYWLTLKKDRENWHWQSHDTATAWFVIFTVILAIWLMIPFGVYLSHAQDLGTIRAQKNVIAVYEKRIDELNISLALMVPKGKLNNQILLNADSPIKGITESISRANADLAVAREKEAQAKVSIAQRKAGPFRFIVTWCGEE